MGQNWRFYFLINLLADKNISPTPPVHNNLDKWGGLQCIWWMTFWLPSLSAQSSVMLFCAATHTAKPDDTQCNTASYDRHAPVQQLHHLLIFLDDPGTLWKIQAPCREDENDFLANTLIHLYSYTLMIIAALAAIITWDTGYSKIIFLFFSLFYFFLL